MIRLILLDFMDTVIPDPFFPLLREYGGAEKFRQVKNAQAYLDFEAGRISEQDYLEKHFFKRGVNPADAGFTPREFRKRLLQSPPVFPEVAELLREIRDKFPVYIASNFGPWFEVHRRNLRLDDHFSGYFVSYQLGARKPEPAFFEQLMEDSRLNGLGREEILFVDDRRENIRAALHFGFQVIRADSERNWVKKARNLLLSD